MSEPVVNPLDGSVSVDLGGQALTFRATLVRMAKFQAECGVIGLGVIEVMLEELDPRALLAGVRHLTVSGDAAAVAEAWDASMQPALAKALLAAIKHGLPRPKPTTAPEEGAAPGEFATTGTGSTGT